MKPRIYTYKITFPYQKWWYWGIHKEKTFGESYDGSPKTHLEKWENFEFEKQILEFFDDWDTARSVEKRLIDPDLNNPLCLNENSVGGFSLDANSKGGKNQSREDKVRAGKIGGKNGSREDKVRAGKSGSREDKARGGKIGNREGKSRGGKIGGKNGSREDKVRAGKNGNRGGKSRGGKTTTSQKWKCLVTGFVTNPGNLTRYQRARGINTNQRIRIND